MYKTKAPDGTNNLCGKNVSILRKKQNLSQNELAIKLQLLNLDFHKNTIQEIESGKRFVTDIELPYLAEALNIDIPSLLNTNNNL